MFFRRRRPRAVPIPPRIPIYVMPPTEYRLRVLQEHLPS